MGKIYDISMPIHADMPVYKNKPEKRPMFEVTSDFPANGVRETRVSLDVHTGTHVDAPLHMVPGGAGIETITLDQLIRRCRVVDLTQTSGGIGAAVLVPVDVKEGEFLLFKTKNSFDDAFNPEFVFLAEDGARYLAERRVAGVGIDGLGVERSQPGHPTHKALFGAGAVIIEGLRLADVPPGEYTMFALPLRLQGLDAAPARVILMTE